MEVFLTVIWIGAHWHCVHNRIHNRLSICTYIGTWFKFNFYHKIRLSVIIILTTTSKALTCYKNYSTHIAALIVTELTFPTSTLLSQSHGLGPGSNVNAVVTRLLLILHMRVAAPLAFVINICTCVCQSHKRV